MKCFCSILSILLVTICAPALAHTVYVGPPGGVDDTATLQAALNECTTPYPEGCVVQLSVGTYETKQLLTFDFHGTLKGMGMNMTTIEALPGLPVTTDYPYYVNPPATDNPYPMLMSFLGGDVTISDLFIKFTAENATVPWHDPWNDVAMNTLNAAVWVSGESANASLNRVKMEGPGLPIPSSFGLWYMPDALGQSVTGSEWLTGRLSVTASVFKSMGWTIFAHLLRDANIMIGGSPQAGNTFEDNWTAVALTSFENTRAEISYNTVTTTMGISDIGMFGYQGWLGDCPKTASTFVMKNNAIRTALHGIWAVDTDWWCEPPQTPVKSQFLVSDNTLYMEPHSGLGILGGMDRGSVFSNNRISGSGYAGIFTFLGTTQCMIKGNNLEHYTAEEGLPDGTYAPIFLDEFTSSCIVIGGNGKTNVVDLGTNDTLVGVNNMKGNPPGPAVKDAMRRKLEALMKGVPKR